jgi:hypothetical protein
MSSPSAERQEDVRNEAEIRKRLGETQMPVDMDLTDFEIKDLPSPPSLFVKKILPEIFSHKKEFNAIPPSKDKEAFKRKPGVTYLYNLCAQHRKGTESFDWFTNTMPENVAIGDGMEAKLERVPLLEQSQEWGLAEAHPDPLRAMTTAMVLERWQ